MTADDGFCIRHRAAIHGAKLAEAIVIADLEERRLTAIFEILSALANGAKGKKAVGSPDFGGAGDSDMICENGAGTDDNVRANNAVRTNLGVSGNVRAGVNNCCGMNHSRSERGIRRSK